MESASDKQPWFAGDKFSAADIQMSFPIEAAAARGVLGLRPRSIAWLENIRQRAAYLRAVERGGRFELLR